VPKVKTSYTTKLKNMIWMIIFESIFLLDGVVSMSITNVFISEIWSFQNLIISTINLKTMKMQLRF